MGKGDFGKTPSVWRPSELGGEVAPALLGGDPWSTGVVTTTSVTEYTYPPGGLSALLPNDLWHEVYNRSGSPLASFTGSVVESNLWIAPNMPSLRLAGFSRLLFITWFDVTSGAVGAHNIPSLKWYVDNNNSVLTAMTTSGVFSFSGVGTTRRCKATTDVLATPQMNYVPRAVTTIATGVSGVSGGTINSASIPLWQSTFTVDVAEDGFGGRISELDGSYLDTNTAIDSAINVILTNAADTIQLLRILILGSGRLLGDFGEI